VTGRPPSTPLTRRALLAGAAASAAASARAAGALRVGVISDLNGSYGSTAYAPSVAAAVARLIDLRPDLVLCTGDMVAGQRKPHLSGAQVAAMWAAFHAAVSDPLAAAGIPFAVTPGNHDASAYEGFAQERAAYAAEWAQRRPAVDWVDGEGWPFAYAFAADGALFVSLDATTVGALPPAQMGWLERLLARGGWRCVIAFSHLPLWPVAVGRETEIIGDPALDALERAGGVDLHLSGHHHAFYPGWKDGVAHVAQACVGAGPRRLIGADAPAERAITLLDIASDGRIAVTAYAGPDYATPVDFGTLPPRIVSAQATLTRLDLAPPGGRVTP
jgi:3',5'-cyclic AMP phosphodiesterase CpdA